VAQAKRQQKVAKTRINLGNRGANLAKDQPRSANTSVQQANPIFSRAFAQAAQELAKLDEDEQRHQETQSDCEEEQDYYFDDVE
jgi:hypothetical protein